LQESRIPRLQEVRAEGLKEVRIQTCRRPGFRLVRKQDSKLQEVRVQSCKMSGFQTCTRSGSRLSINQDSKLVNVLGFRQLSALQNVRGSNLGKLAASGLALFYLLDSRTQAEREDHPENL
jgi:hypothetical protein